MSRLASPHLTSPMAQRYLSATRAESCQAYSAFCRRVTLVWRMRCLSRCGFVGFETASFTAGYRPCVPPGTVTIAMARVKRGRSLPDAARSKPQYCTPLPTHSLGFNTVCLPSFPFFISSSPLFSPCPAMTICCYYAIARQAGGAVGGAAGPV